MTRAVWTRRPLRRREGEDYQDALDRAAQLWPDMRVRPATRPNTSVYWSVEVKPR